MKIMCAVLGFLFGVVLFLFGLYCLSYFEDLKTVGIVATITGNILSTLGLITISEEE